MYCLNLVGKKKKVKFKRAGVKAREISVKSGRDIKSYAAKLIRAFARNLNHIIFSFYD